MSQTALLFAGQGSQTVGMGRDLCEKYAVSRQLFEQANSVLGRDLMQICFAGPEAVLTQTDNAQPGIFLTSLACWAVLQSQIPDLKFSATAGLSLGEFTALTAAGVLSFEDGLRMVQARGRFMPEADVDIANLNCPGQTVISGAKEKIAKAVELAKARGAKRAIPLPVAGAYHSRLKVGAQQKVAAELARMPLGESRVPVVANVSARPGGSMAEIKDLLTRQVTGTVRWTESMQWLIAQGFTRFIELGPGTVLAGLMKRINKDVEVISVNDCATLAAAVIKLRG